MPTDRYNRQTLLTSFGEKGQRKLAASTIAIVGLGALGTHHAETLVRMGIGELILIDRDIVEFDNLNRQVLFTEQDAKWNSPKAEVAMEHLSEINSGTELITHIKHLGPGNIAKLLDGTDLILDGTDNFITRYLLNDYSRANGIPYIYCGVVGYEATCFPILSGGPCLRCLFRDMPDPSMEPACDTFGVWPPVVGIISGMGVDLALRWLLNIPPADGWPMIFIDLATGTMKRRILAGLNDPDCPACDGRYEFLNADEIDMVHMCGSGAYQVFGSGEGVDFDAIMRKIAAVGRTSQKPYLLQVDFNDGVSLSLFRDGRAIIRGVENSGRAKAIYDKYIGS